MIYWRRLNVLVSLWINNLRRRWRLCWCSSLRERSCSTLLLLSNRISRNKSIGSSVRTHVGIAVSIRIICWTDLKQLLFILEMLTHHVRRGTMKEDNFFSRKLLLLLLLGFKLIRFRFWFNDRITIRIRATRCLSCCFDLIQDYRFPLIIESFIKNMRTQCNRDGVLFKRFMSDLLKSLLVIRDWIRKRILNTRSSWDNHCTIRCHFTWC